MVAIRRAREITTAYGAVAAFLYARVLLSYKSIAASDYISSLIRRSCAHRTRYRFARHIGDTPSPASTQRTASCWRNWVKVFFQQSPIAL